MNPDVILMQANASLRAIVGAEFALLTFAEALHTLFRHHPRHAL